ncbi:MAG: galactose mutarotase [Eubacterium sp.]|nr:galactose mutarotase [Eubacterium sp.]
MTEKRPFGILPDGKQAYLYTIRSGALTAEITDFGAAPVSLVISGRDPVDVVMGLDDAGAYARDDGYFGALIGRFATRIEQGAFTLNGKQYQTGKNEGENNLHSGPDGYHQRLWTFVPEESGANHLKLKLESPDGDQGFPGNAEISITYRVTDGGSFRLLYEGICDQDTPMNLTSHTYFNLNGHDAGDVLAHRVKIPALYYTPVKDAGCIPTGEIASVQGTAFDFTEEKEIGAEIDGDCEQLQMTGGYDHNYVITMSRSGLRTALEAYSARTGLHMTVETDLPGFHFYTGNNLTRRPGKGGCVYDRRGGFCVETQYFPNSVNVPAFPSPILRAGEKYRAETVFRFARRESRGCHSKPFVNK